MGISESCLNSSLPQAQPQQHRCLCTELASLSHDAVRTCPNLSGSSSKELDWAAAARNPGTALALAKSSTNPPISTQAGISLPWYALFWLYATSHDTAIPAALPCSPAPSLANVSGSLHLLLNRNTLTQWIDFIICKTSSTSDYFTLNAQRTFTCNLDMQGIQSNNYKELPFKYVSFTFKILFIFLNILY